MKPLTLVVVLLAVLSLWACSQEKSEQKPQPAAEQSQPAASQTAGQMAEQAGKQIQETASAAKQAVEEKAADVKQQVEEGAAAVKEQAVATADQAKQQVAGIAEQAKQAVTPLVAAKPAPAPPKGPSEVTYKASMGTVTFNHAMHSGKFACSRCHTTDPPQKIAMSKDVAHNQLCKVCHQAMGGNAPTACTGCHKK